MRVAAKDINGMSTEDFQRYGAQLIGDIIALLNGEITFAENMAVSSVSITFASANVDTSIEHGLNRLPTGYLAAGRSAALTVYDGSSANVNTTKKIFLRSSAIGTATILVY